MRSLICLMIAVLFLLTRGYSQVIQDSIDLPTLSELDSCLTAYTHNECAAQLVAYTHKQTKPWKELLPSVGLGYTALGELRPSISWSPLQVLDRAERKQKDLRQREAITLSCDVLIKERLYKLHQLYKDYLLEVKILTARQATLLIDEELFAITERKYQEHLIKPSEYLAAKRTILQVRSNIAVMVLELEKLRNEVLWVARVNCF